MPRAIALILVAALLLILQPGCEEDVELEVQTIIRARDGDVGLQTVIEGPRVGEIHSLSFTPDGNLLAVGGCAVAVERVSEDYVPVWDMRTGECVTRLASPATGRVSVAFSPDGQLLATASYGPPLRLWDTETWQQIREIPPGTDIVDGIAFSPDGTLLASAGDDEVIRLWDVQTGAEVRSLRGFWAERVRSVAFSPDGKLLASGSWDSWLQLWDVESGEEVGATQTDELSIECVGFSPDGQTLVSCGASALRGWHVPGLEGVFVGQRFIDNGIPWNCQLFAAAFSPDGQTIATGGSDNTVRLWENLSGGHVSQLPEPSGEVGAVAFHPSGHLLASGAQQGIVRLWDIEAGEWALAFQSLPDGCWVTYTPDASCILSPGAEQYLRWQVGGESQAFETLAEEHVRPDLIQQLLGRLT
jgi:WD40 repeat protein